MSGVKSGRLLLALSLAAGLAVMAGCGGSSSSSSSSGGAVGGTGYPGLDLANTRLAEGEIERSNAAQLKLAWSVPSEAQSTYGAYAATPVVVNGTVYMQDLESNVQAIDLESGDVAWTKEYNEADQGPNGVVVGEGMVFGATPTKAFALDQESGEQVWATPLAKGPLAIDMSPGNHDGLVYVSTVPTNVNSEYPAGGVGTLYALDAKTGKVKWEFATVPKDLWGDPAHNSGGGLWYAPSFDGKGSMYFGTGNPAPFPGAAGKPFGSSRPGPNLYTDSIVKLNAKTGKLDWYYQQTPHDIYDWDFQNPPVLTSVGGRELAIGSGKSGIVTAVDAKTGKPVWSTPVGKHNGHDDDGLLAMRKEYSKIKMGEVSPGTLGGAIAPVAANESTVFVPIVNHPLKLESGERLGNGIETAGELVALDVRTGKEVWNAEFEAPALGAPVAINDMVFLATFDGTVHGFDAKTGGEVWQETLPAGSNTAVTASGNTLLVPAGVPTAEGQTPELVAFRLGG
jgi:outer membrane protein assembly factor BamB